MKSKIGIVICGLMGEKQFVSDAYIKAVKSAGGLPIILPLVKSNEVIADYVKLCSGFLFCGAVTLRRCFLEKSRHVESGRRTLRWICFRFDL